ncbi:hypothetical protein B0H14DRAFT_3779761 [Mycena olivaceomarginata]|nr:hypothetical protein B0H14DRAFT_3779761 [Mycena olivaceomarginata]
MTIEAFLAKANRMNALSGVSFTDDIWTRQNLDAHLAITAHYIIKDANGHLVLLVAIRRVDGSHTGLKEIGTPVHLAEVIEYPVAEVFELAGNHARNNKKCRPH